MFQKYSELPPRLKQLVDARLEDAGCTPDELTRLLFAQATADEIRRLIAPLTSVEAKLVAVNFDEQEAALIALWLMRGILECRLIGEKPRIRVFKDAEIRAFLDALR